MEKFSYRKKVDLYMTMLLTYYFILCISFNFLNLSSNLENYIMFSILMIVSVLAYYTNITLTLLSTIIIDFIYASYKLYLDFTNIEKVEFYAYYWVVLIPVSATLVATLAKNIILIQEQVRKLEKLSSELVMIDEETGIRNSSAFFNEMPIYMSISKRYELPVNLMLIRFKYKENLANLIGKEGFKNAFIKTSDTISNSLRYEDRKYILDDRTFAFILISTPDGCEVVKKRVKENISSMKFEGKHKIHKNIKIEVEVGYYTYNDEVKDVFGFVELAKRELEYDV